MGLDRESLYVTVGELAWLCDAAGLGIPDEAEARWTALTPAQRSSLLEVAAESLADRGMVVSGTTVAEIHEALTAIANPWLVANAAVDIDGVDLGRRYVAGTELGIEIESVAPLVVRVGIYSLLDIVDHIVAFVDPGGRAAASAPEFTVAVDVLEAALDVDDGEVEGAIAALTDGGLDVERAETVAAALQDYRGAGTVEAHHRSDDDSVISGHVTWLDLGKQGLMSGSVTDGAATLAPTHRDELIGSIRGLFPSEMQG